MNLEQKIYRKDGGEAVIVKKPEKKDEKRAKNESPMTVKDLIEHALLENGEDKDPQSHVKRYALWEKIKGQKDVDLLDEEKELLEKLVAEKMEILVSAQVIKELRQ